MNIDTESRQTITVHVWKCLNTILQSFDLYASKHSVNLCG